MNKEVNPSRMELLSLKNRLSIAKRGHKLLKDKQDEFIQRFILVIKDYQDLRNKVETKIKDLLYYYNRALTKETIDNKLDLELVKYKRTVNLAVKSEKNLGVLFNSIEIKDFTNNLDFLNSNELNAATILIHKDSKELLNLIITLGNTEEMITKMINEIEKSKRRVNAIENIVIKEMEESIKRIIIKLDELELNNTIRMMKSKDIISKKGNE